MTVLSPEQRKQLTRARYIYAKCGGAQYDFVDNSGRICLANALHYGVTGEMLPPDGGNGADLQGIDDLVRVLDIPFKTYGAGSACSFNNQHTKEEILAKLDEALGSPPATDPIPDLASCITREEQQQIADRVAALATEFGGTLGGPALLIETLINGNLGFPGGSRGAGVAQSVRAAES